MRFIFKTRYDQDIDLAKHDGHRFWYGLLFIALLAAPWLLPEYWLAQLTFVFIYAIVAVGLMLLAGFTGQFSIGHAAFMGVGAYTEAFLAAKGWPFPLSMACAMGLSAARGGVVGSTLAVLNLLRAPTGRAFVAIRDSEISAQSMGIHLARYKSMSFAISAALAGLGCALYAHQIQFLSPEQFGLVQSIDLVLMIVIGGLGSIHGAFFGAVFLIGMPQLISMVKDYLPAAIGQATVLQAVVYGVILIAFVMLEPMGMYGRWLKIRTWLELYPFYRRGMFKRQKTFQKSERLK